MWPRPQRHAACLNSLARRRQPCRLVGCPTTAQGGIKNRKNRKKKGTGEHRGTSTRATSTARQAARLRGPIWRLGAAPRSRPGGDETTSRPDEHGVGDESCAPDGALDAVPALIRSPGASRRPRSRRGVGTPLARRGGRGIGCERRSDVMRSNLLFCAWLAWGVIFPFILALSFPLVFRGHSEPFRRSPLDWSQKRPQVESSLAPAQAGPNSSPSRTHIGGQQIRRWLRGTGRAPGKLGRGSRSQEAVLRRDAVAAGSSEKSEQKARAMERREEAACESESPLVLSGSASQARP